jgi:hypothetical protein
MGEHRRALTYLAVLSSVLLGVGGFAISSGAARDLFRAHPVAARILPRARTRHPHAHMRLVALKPGPQRPSRVVHHRFVAQPRHRLVPRVRYARHPRSLLSVPYLPKGPKNQLAPGRGNTRRVKAGPSSTAFHNTGPKAAVAPDVCAAPSAPGSPTATGGANSATINWTAANANGSTISGYVVTAVSGTTAENAIGTPASATSATLSGLASGSDTFTIYAVSNCGNGAVATTSATSITGSASTYASTVIGLNPSAYFRLGEPTGTSVAADSSGHAALGTYNTDTNILLGQAGALPSDSATSIKDSDGEWVASVSSDPSLPVGNQPRTVQAWVKPLDAVCRWVLGYGQSGTNTAFNLGECGGSVAVSAYSDDLYFPTHEPLNDGAWHMITVTYNGSTVTAYLDGTSLGTRTFSSAISTSPGGLALGSWESRCCNSWTYGGLQDEAVYPTALSAAQVTSVFNASGDGVPTKPGSPTANSSSNNTATVSWTASTAPGGNLQGYLVTALKGTAVAEEIAAPSGATSATLTGLKSGSYTFSVAARDPYGSGPTATTASLAVAGASSTYLSTVLVDKPSLFWRLDEPSSTLLTADSSGKGILGFYSTSCITQGVAGPLANDAATGTNDSSACEPIATESYPSNLPYGNTARTLQAWIKPDDGNCRYFMGYGGSYTDGMFNVGACGDAVLVSLYSDDHSFFSSRNIDDGSWHLVTVTSTDSASGNTVTAYLDGQKLGSVVTGTPNTQSGSGLEVGGSPSNCCYYGGVADAAVYPKALSAGQISALLSAAGNAVPTAPGSVQATGAANKATITWTASSAPGTTVTGYVVTELNSSGKVQQSVAASGTATSATIDSLPSGSYKFKVVAYDTYGASAAATTSGSTSVTGSATTYAGETISLKPALYYRLGETGTLIAADSSGNGVLGQYDTSGVTQGITGALNDGSDQAASLTSGFLVQAGGSTTIPSGDGARTVEAWVKPADAYCNRQLLGFGTQNTDQAFMLGECPNYVTVDAYNDLHYFQTPRTLDDGAWHFLAATYTDTGGVDQITAYLDGQSLGTESFANPISTPSDSTLWVGAGANDCCNTTYGGIDEAAVFPAALTASNISTQFADSLNAVPAAPAGISVSPGANQATVNWTAPSSADAITGYIVTAYAGSTPRGSVGTPPGATSATISGLPNGSYTFKVVAEDAYGPGPAGTSSSTAVTGTASTYASTVLAAGPVADYGLSEPSGSPYAADSSPGGLTATYNTSHVTGGVAGAIPTDPATAVSSDGGAAIAYDTFASDASLPAANAPRSVVAWIKPKDTNCRYVLGWGGGGTDQGFGVYTCMNQVVVSGVNDTVTFNTPTTLTDGNWHQIAVTFDGTNITAYVDGNPLGTQQFSAPNDTLASSGLYIGAGPNDAGNFWYGALDDVAVFPAALSASQVTGLFTASGYAAPTAPGNVQATGGANQATVSWNAATAPNSTVTGYVVTALVGGTTAANAVATAGTASSVTLHGLKGSQAYTFRVQAVDPYGTGPGASSGSVTPTGGATTFAGAVLADGPVAYYRLGEGTGSLAADSSGNGNLGDYNSSTTTLGAGGALGAPDTDPSTAITETNGGGYDAFVGSGASNPLPTGSAARTLSAWIKPTDSGCRVFAGYGLETTDEAFGVGDACDGANSIYVNGWSDDLEFPTTVNLHDGNWHFIVVTYTAAGSVTVYVDGAAAGSSQTIPQPLATPAGTALYIGAGEQGYSSWYGGLQDLAVYPSALSASQVSTLYADR